jgi:hypothetical protein
MVGFGIPLAGQSILIGVLVSAVMLSPTVMLTGLRSLGFNVRGLSVEVIFGFTGSAKQFQNIVLTQIPSIEISRYHNFTTFYPRENFKYNLFQKCL